MSIAETLHKQVGPEAVAEYRRLILAMAQGEEVDRDQLQEELEAADRTQMQAEKDLETARQRYRLHLVVQQQPQINQWAAERHLRLQDAKTKHETERKRLLAEIEALSEEQRREEEAACEEFDRLVTGDARHWLGREPEIAMRRGSPAYQREIAVIEARLNAFHQRRLQLGNEEMLLRQQNRERPPHSLYQQSLWKPKTIEQRVELFTAQVRESRRANGSKANDLEGELQDLQKVLQKIAGINESIRAIQEQERELNKKLHALFAVVPEWTDMAWTK